MIGRLCSQWNSILVLFHCNTQGNLVLLFGFLLLCLVLFRLSSIKPTGDRIAPSPPSKARSMEVPNNFSGRIGTPFTSVMGEYFIDFSSSTKRSTLKHIATALYPAKRIMESSVARIKELVTPPLVTFLALTPGLRYRNSPRRHLQ